MAVLLDTCVLLWIITDSPLLPKKTREYLNKTSPRYVSAISFAEIEIKRSIGKLTIPDDYRNFIESSGLKELPLFGSDTAGLSSLPFHHKDPFDRLLISQAIARNLPILTPDENFAAYPIKMIPIS